MTTVWVLKLIWSTVRWILKKTLLSTLIGLSLVNHSGVLIPEGLV